jgi:histone deacetylase complex regulatory component SIN3
MLSFQPHSRRDAHLSVSAERRFFDTVKDSLLSQSRECWADFVKCLDMFANDALSKEELLNLLADVLGPFFFPF